MLLYILLLELQFYHIVLNLYNEKQNPNTLVGSKTIIIAIILALCFVVAISVFKKRKAVYLITIVIALMTSVFVVKALCKSEFYYTTSHDVCGDERWKTIISCDFGN